ncbi:MAG TPA: radical SAM protein [Caldilineae bacterium]|nr:radical SAM protein [Caldilineae bacterium]
MPFSMVTYSRRFKRANIYSDGRCNFRCRGCSYNLNPPTKASGPALLTVERVKEVLTELDVERVHFLGGEPTLNPDLAEVARFAHKELGLFTKIGHSNGSNMPPDHIDAVSVSIKAFDDALHREYTGVSNAPVLANFKTMYQRGIQVDASSVFIPEFIDLGEIERIVRFIASLDPEIPYHITGYVPVPGAPWRAPTREEVEEAADVARRYLAHVTFSALTQDDLLHLRERDVRYQSVRVA